MVLLRPVCRARGVVLLASGFLGAVAGACGSPESSSFSRTVGSGGAPSAGAGNDTGAGGTAYAGAGGLGGSLSFGNGGVSNPSGGFPPGVGASSAGGAFGAGGFTLGDSGILGSGGLGPGSGGTSAGSGGSLDAGAPVNPFPAGSLVSQPCSNCAMVSCQAEERVCAADPACVAIGKCISSCFGPTCLACLTTLSNQTAYDEFVAVSQCTDKLCQPVCPYLNLGGGGTNP